ncbi:DUF2505 domain-containing protein [Corynebacterium sp. 153RC1]|uniref:DUF2505 domain-containing protein n=1 Tax=unclassified Corynebacterium TaxID=2624378 RepID=UPI00211C4939|nr:MULTISPECIES: DUF2505 domain-containing protein [unclassified Corynebacterium]MCQ9370586.1 DUF2505 domain-containing protein [Corynebacterium sp. 35RC1]MCQ9351759.1 DUF2505 domain-containing protein [Corynebacterium sp. 209RC1]MCQ9354495.1 DUF2505 domain-containing protein [Corynebacterium sp. 1222RC1]MCQ9356041.1 DUF2505 domain-containing protein [Corynebacterium sp. 122RC1]MCQ9358673.1 DUF2505 domain-containing protein [Corynebacterium sp. 142RC1]
MTTRSENTATIGHPLEKVQQAFASADYWSYIAANLSPEPGELHELTNTDGTTTAVLYEVLPLDILPEAVRGMISQALKVKRVVTVGSQIAYTADVKGTPVDFSGTITPQSDGTTTTLTYANEITVNIPFMGPAIEPKVGEALAELFQNEANLTTAWISDNL